MLRPHRVEQHAHGREAALQFTDGITVERRVGQHPQLTVDGVGDLRALRLGGEQVGEVPAEMVQHGGNQRVLAAEVRWIRPWFTRDRAAISRIDVAARPRSANRSAADRSTAATTSSLPSGAPTRCELVLARAVDT